MKIVIGCDHAALTLKDAVKAHLLELGHEVKDFGIYQAGEKCDYPEKAAEVAFGERVVGQGLAMELVDAFLTTEFEGGRHQRRVDLITKLEQEENS